MARLLLALALVALAVSCTQGDTIDDCYWRLYETEREIFDMYAAGIKLSPMLESRLDQGWQETGCSVELPPEGEVYIVKKPKPLP